MLMPFERVVGDSSKDHPVAALTSATTLTTTDQLHHYAGLNPGRGAHHLNSLRMIKQGGRDGVSKPLGWPRWMPPFAALTSWRHTGITLGSSAIHDRHLYAFRNNYRLKRHCSSRYTEHKLQKCAF